MHQIEPRSLMASNHHKLVNMDENGPLLEGINFPGTYS